MKKVKLMTLAALVAAISMTFTSCGGDDAKSDESKDKKGTEASASNEGGETASNEGGEMKAAPVGNFNLETGIGHIQQLVSSLEGGNVVIDKTNSADVLAYYNIVDKYAEADDDYFNGKSSFAGYNINKGFYFYKNTLNNLHYRAKFDDENDDKVINETDAIYAYLVEVFGKPESRKYPEWITDKYEVSFSTYDSGYEVRFESVTIDKYKQDRLDAVVEGTAVNEVTKILNGLSDGSIVMNKTSMADFGTLVTMDVEGYYPNDKIQYFDHYINRTAVPEDGVLSEINLYIAEDHPDYDYEETAKADVVNLLTTTLGTDFVTAGKTKTWTKEGYSVVLEDEYNVQIDIK